MDKLKYREVHNSLFRIGDIHSSGQTVPSFLHLGEITLDADEKFSLRFGLSCSVLCRHVYSHFADLFAVYRESLLFSYHPSFPV